MSNRGALRPPDWAPMKREISDTSACSASFHAAKRLARSLA
jgi:hypothetical protein